MPYFGSQKYRDIEDHDRALQQAREDLGGDYPDCNMFVYEQPGNTDDMITIIRMQPPPGYADVVRGDIQLKSKSWFYRDRGYRYVVFAEGTLIYRGHWRYALQPHSIRP